MLHSKDFDERLTIPVSDLVQYLYVRESVMKSDTSFSQEVLLGYLMAIKELLIECHRLNSQYRMLGNVEDPNGTDGKTSVPDGVIDVEKFLKQYMRRKRNEEENP